MEGREGWWWFQLPGLAQITLGPNFSEFRLNEAWDSTRVALTKAPYVLLTGFCHHVSTVICFAERIEHVLNEGQKICVDVSMASANEAMICILMSRVLRRHWHVYHFQNNPYKRDIRVLLDRNNRGSGFTVPPQIWDVIMGFRMLVLAAYGSVDVQRAIKVAETLLYQTRIPDSVCKIAVAVMVTGNGEAMIEILLSPDKPQPPVPPQKNLRWLRQPKAIRSGSNSTRDVQQYSSL